MRARRSLALGGLLLLVLGASPAHAQASFQGLGQLPGAIPGSVAGDLSADGLVVVGGCPFGATCNEAWRWTQAGGMQGLGFLPGESVSGASATSSDGAVVFGGTEDSIFRWTSAGMVDIGASLPSGPNLQVFPWDLSSDGLVAIGLFFDFGPLVGGAFRWTSDVGIEVLNPFGIPDTVTFRALSADGAVIVGSSGIPDDQNAFFRTDAGGFTFLPDLPFADCQCGTQAHGVSEDGETIVGTSQFEAFRWTAATGTVGLGLLGSPAAGGFDIGLDVSSDGSVVVGSSESTGALTAFIWTEGTGILELRQVLSLQGVDMTGWTLTRAVAVSADGKVIAGSGINPAGEEEAWIASVPVIPIVPGLAPGGAGLLWVLLAGGGACALRFVLSPTDRRARAQA